MKKLITSISITLALTACMNTSNSSSDATIESINVNKPKNIIMVVADGMGPAYTTAYRYFNDDPTTKLIEETVFDRILTGMSSTYPAPISGFVTDSAAGATALATGIKTYNGAIGLDVDKNEIETVLEYAKAHGKKTGVVVTSQINHATPASYLTHNESRRNYNAIADSYIDNGIKADLLLGGGWQYFIREDRNLVNEFKNNGFHYIDNYDQLTSLPKNKAILGLFDDKGLPWALDDVNPHRLLAMTKAATNQIENDQGYFMLIEASQVDWAGHSNDVASAMAEMTDLAKTMEYLEQYVGENPDTLVILTADHSTGGFTIGAHGKYEWHPEVLRTMKHSPQEITKQFMQSDITLNLASSLLNFAINEKEVKQLQTAKSNAADKLAAYLELDEASQKIQRKPSVEKAVYMAINKIIDQRTNTGWTSGGHTAIDVPVHAFGSNSELFSGQVDNTDIAKTIFTLLGKK